MSQRLIVRCATQFARLSVGVLISATVFAQASDATRGDEWPNLESVRFASGDGHTELVGYAFVPTAGRGPFPAIVMLHGRAGPYSSDVNRACTWVGSGVASPCNAHAQTKRAKMWGAFWAERGVLALHVDSFGPRGRAHGYARHSHDDPDREAVNELTVRPLDAEGALRYLRTRGDVLPERIALQGWSNGASAALNALSRQAEGSNSTAGFRQALVFYPGCGRTALLHGSAYRAGAPTTVFLAAEDEEVDPDACRKVLAHAPAASGEVELVLYSGATHDFDDPGHARHDLPANAEAQQDAMRRSARLIDAALKR